MYPPPPREIDLTAHKSKGSTRESQSGPGVAYRAGKSDTPLGIIVAELRFPNRCEQRRENFDDPRGVRCRWSSVKIHAQRPYIVRL
jgi:hypothetical protein